MFQASDGLCDVVQSKFITKKRKNVSSITHSGHIPSNVKTPREGAIK